jgi:molybdopterin synthase catalytic subunit
VASFLGLCRSEEGRLSGLELEHYPGMAEAELSRVAAEAAARWPLHALTVIHRFGLIRPGERIVLVAASSSHREAAFAAAGFVMDYLKTRAPFWKREHIAGGGVGPWVDAKASDDAAAARWVG